MHIDSVLYKLTIDKSGNGWYIPIKSGIKRGMWMLTEDNRYRGGRVPKRAVFTYEDIAKKKGVEIAAVRAAVSKGILDISDLDSIMRYIKRKRGPEKKK